MKEKLARLLEGTGVVQKTIWDRRFRTVAFTGASLIWNLIYGIYNGVLGALYSSAWFAVMFVYYLTLCVMRFSAMPFEKQRKGGRTEAAVMRRHGTALLFLAGVLAVSVLVSVVYGVKKSYSAIVMIGIAAYTFYIAVFAVINMMKARREKSVFLMMIRNISMAAATASMVSLERSMIATFGPDDTDFAFLMDVCTGAGGFGVVAALGVSMIRSADRQ